MGNNYCCAYNEKPEEDFTIESTQILLFITYLLENNINIALKFYANQGKDARDSVTSSRASLSSEAKVSISENIRIYTFISTIEESNNHFRSSTISTSICT